MDFMKIIIIIIIIFKFANKNEKIGTGWREMLQTMYLMKDLH